jgi:hypothetical protein
MLPPRRGLAASPQQESSAHDGRVSGDSIPIWSVTLTRQPKRGEGPANLADRLDASMRIASEIILSVPQPLWASVERLMAALNESCR